MIELVTLAHQLATAFKESLSDFLRVAFPVLLQRVWLCVESDWDWTGRTRITRETGKSTNTDGVILDETREKEQLQRLYYGLIYAVFANCNAMLVLDLHPETLQMMLNTVLQVRLPLSCSKVTFVELGCQLSFRDFDQADLFSNLCPVG